MHYFASVGEQNLPPQNVSLAWGLFQADDNQGPKDSGRTFDLPPNCLKNVDGGRAPEGSQPHR